MRKYARCAKCGEFDPVEKMVTLECPSCKYTTHRHKSGEACAGMTGAWRSILAHFRYYMKQREGLAGHTAVILNARRIVTARATANLIGRRRA